MTQSQQLDETRAVPAAAPSGWSYDEAFSRHRGLVSAEEQQKLRASRVAIVGMGGVGGTHLVTLARLGIGRFNIADPDAFEVANFNRQCGATTRSLGRSKVEVMAEEALAINPEADMRLFGAVTPSNVGDFLDGAQVLIDGIDFFSLALRRVMFREARRRGLWGVTAGPLGFSAAWLSFSPTGMSFDEYFDLNDSMSPSEQIVAFLIGLAPRATQLGYIDMEAVNPARRQTPSAGLACQLCGGVVAAEVLKILLGRSSLRPAPAYWQFDAYSQVLRKGYLRWGNRNPVQRLKRWVAGRQFARRGWDRILAPPAAAAPVDPTGV